MNYSKWIKHIPAQLAHQLAPSVIHWMASRQPENSIAQWRSFKWQGLEFPNPFGIAGGVDKNAKNILDWPKLGAGFLEVGTVTPYSQKANPGKILDRDWDNKNLWNKMGFPNDGVDEVYFNLLNQKSEIPIPLFVNIGKNRDRPNEEAEVDYMYLADRFAAVADAFVINISSPNTQGLRDLQSQDSLKKILKAVRDKAPQVPFLVKLSPDMMNEAFEDCLETCALSGAKGFILTNTTTSRPANCAFPSEGGLSGKDLKELSKKHLTKTISFLSDHRSEFLLVSTGGILTPDDAKERLDMGADLIQTYSGLVFYGPRIFHDTAQLVAQESF